MNDNFCLFHKQGKIAFGLILGQQKSKLVIHPLQGREFNAPANQLLYQWQASCPTDLEAALKELGERSERALAEAAQTDLAIVHELMEPGLGLEFDEIAQDFAQDPDSGWSRVALLLALLEEELLFQQKKLRFTPRSQEEMDAILAEEAKKKEAQERTETEEAWAKELLEGRRPQDANPEHFAQFAKRVANFLHHWDYSQEKELFSRLFHLDLKEQRSAEQKLLPVMALLERPTSWGRLSVERLMGETGFDEAETELSLRLTQEDATQSALPMDFADLTGLVTHSVDNETTLDYDDALSFRAEGENLRLYSHIALVAHKITPEHPLFAKAEERVSSLYTPKGVYPMLHPSLSEEYFSLTAGHQRAVMTHEILLDPMGEVLESSLYPALIQVTDNLSYEAVDRLIEEGHEDWNLLNDFTQALLAKRERDGALTFARREVSLDIEDPSAVKIKGYRTDSPASVMIQETAILTNHLAAKFLQDKGAAALFRNQAPYTLLRELPEGEKPQFTDLRFSAAKLSTFAEGHSALGLSAYTQTTSPIRRFLDLVIQSQILSLLALERPAFSSDKLEYWMTLIDEKSRQMAQLERNLNQHWKLRYLEQNQEREFAASYQRELANGRHLINLEEVELTWPIFLEEPKETLTVRIDLIEAQIDRMDLREV